MNAPSSSAFWLRMICLNWGIRELGNCIVEPDHDLALRDLSLLVFGSFNKRQYIFQGGVSFYRMGWGENISALAAHFQKFF